MLQDDEEKELFLKSEKRIEKIWKIACSFMIFEVVFNVVAIGILEIVSYKVTYFLFTLNELFILPGLVYSYGSLVQLLK